MLVYCWTSRTETATLTLSVNQETGLLNGVFGASGRAFFCKDANFVWCTASVMRDDALHPVATVTFRFLKTGVKKLRDGGLELVVPDVTMEGLVRTLHVCPDGLIIGETNEGLLPAFAERA